jgi:hypothetical protein
MQHFFDPPDNAIDRYAAEPTFPSVLSRLNAASLKSGESRRKVLGEKVLGTP